MTRYKKSIHKALEEVSEWEEAQKPQILIEEEEEPISTETGRELLKKRIAHQKIEKKELKYYPMGNVFRGKLQKTTEYLKEALELDELDEAVKWEVKVTGLPVFYSDGKSKGAVKQMLRKLLKHPDDIQSINRVTSAELKKIRRGQIAGDEPGDEDEDKSPVGPSYNEEQELDEAGRPRGAARIENERFWDLKDKELHYIIKDAGQAVQANPTSKKATQGPGNWSDQINDAATVLYWRKKKNIKVESVNEAAITVTFDVQDGAKFKNALKDHGLRGKKVKGDGGVRGDSIEVKGDPKKLKKLAKDDERGSGNILRINDDGQLKEAAIDDLKKIVKTKSIGKVSGVKVDLFSASAMVKVYDALNSKNQAKVDKMLKDKRGIATFQDFAFSQVKK